MPPPCIFLCRDLNISWATGLIPQSQFKESGIYSTLYKDDFYYKSQTVAMMLFGLRFGVNVTSSS